MGQKIHPLGFRLGITKKHRSQWFAKTAQYPQLVLEDSFIRQILLEKFIDAGITHIEIQRKLDQIKIEIRAARPGILVGRDGVNLEILRKLLEQKLSTYRLKTMPGLKLSNLFSSKNENITAPIQVAIHVTKLANPDSEAGFIADFLVEQLEKRVAFRRAVRQAIQRAQRAGVSGIKIQISGRLNGAEIARSEWVREGRVPLQTLRADIDYCYKTAKTIYGLLGIKIWVFKNN
uniref:Small ribosomal subunit protein uS3c n=1 Tax=Koliella longiseta TaxID=33092 RepID=A0A097KLE8_9CHLO|nr:ribosomal protein S3 [Koliella longiseta]AIT94025.1 ribosomal protein S3 [Koliella longiseta]